MNDRRAILLAVFACALLSGCGSNDGQIETSSSRSGESAPRYEQPTMDVLKGKAQPFPAQYPLRQYPHSKVTYAWVKPDLRPGMKNMVMVQTDDDPVSVRNYYVNDLPRQGWRLVDKWETPVYSSTIWQKDDQECEVRVSPDPYGNNNVQLLYGPIRRQKIPVPAVPTK